MPNTNANMNRAQHDTLDDEYYTRREDIEKELQHYPGAFEGKIVYCNCDDPFKSEFFKYFKDNFARLGLKKLVATCYNRYRNDLFAEENHLALHAEHYGEKGTAFTYLNGDGDFESEECKDLMMQADIVVTNPPFSMSNRFLLQLIENKKDFLVIGNFLSVAYRKIWPHYQAGRIRFGVGKRCMHFTRPDGTEKEVNACWITTLENNRKPLPLEITEKYTPEKYPKYDNYDAIEVDDIRKIPVDYNGKMGVPVTYMMYNDPKEFCMIGMEYEMAPGSELLLNEFKIYRRIIIQRCTPYRC